MSRFFKQGKAAFASPTTFKETMQNTSGDGEVRYNKDLLPSPIGKLLILSYMIFTDIVQGTENGGGNTTSHTI
jgi:hypothetical protein